MKRKEIIIKKGFTKKIKNKHFIKSEINIKIKLEEKEQENLGELIRIFKKESAAAWGMVKKEIKRKEEEYNERR